LFVHHNQINEKYDNKNKNENVGSTLYTVHNIHAQNQINNLLATIS